MSNRFNFQAVVIIIANESNTIESSRYLIHFQVESDSFRSLFTTRAIARWSPWTSIKYRNLASCLIEVLFNGNPKDISNKRLFTWFCSPLITIGFLQLIRHTSGDNNKEEEWNDHHVQEQTLFWIRFQKGYDDQEATIW